MLIDFDKAKDLVNLGKHGLSLALAAEVDWEHALAWADKRRDYREVRMIAFSTIDRNLVQHRFCGSRPNQARHQPTQSKSS